MCTGCSGAGCCGRVATASRRRLAATGVRRGLRACRRVVPGVGEVGAGVVVIGMAAGATTRRGGGGVGGCGGGPHDGRVRRGGADDGGGGDEEADLWSGAAAG